MRSATRKKTGKDPAYLDWIRRQGCMICGSARVEAAHVGLRGMSQKCPDREAVPLCAVHHRTGEASHHRLGKRFWDHYGIERDGIIAFYQRGYEAEL